MKVPLKIKVFLWQIDNNRLSTALSLRQRGWKGSSLCCLCGNTEDSNHIFFGCSLARFLWCGIRDALGWSDFPFSWEDWRGRWIHGRCNMPIKFNMLLFVGITWALWNTRNKMAIEHITSRSPLQVFHHGIIFVQKWCQLLILIKTRCGRWLNI